MMVRKCSLEPKYRTMVNTPPTKTEESMIRTKLTVSIRKSRPFITKAPLSEINKANHCQNLTRSFKNKKANKTPKIGAVYRSATVDANGMRCITRKNNARDVKLNTPRKLNQKTFLPIMGTLLASIYGKIKTKVPIARKKTTCKG